MAISSNTFLSDYIIFLRNDFQNNITDPISGTRSGNERFCYTSYPSRDVKYPIITVRNEDVTMEPLGEQSNQMETTIYTEARVWARSEKEKSELSEQLLNRIRNNFYPSTTSGTALFNDLYGRRILSATNVDESGKAGIKSKVVRFRYNYILV